jgi:hypothetical protein
MTIGMVGRRLPVVPGQHPTPELPGDYVGPVMGYSGDKPARARSVHHVTAPPHTFIEESDGTLTIRNSIGDRAGPGSESDGWHGFLERGVWREA